MTECLCTHGLAGTMLDPGCWGKNLVGAGSVDRLLLLCVCVCLVELLGMKDEGQGKGEVDSDVDTI